ncbi:hypothetical protein EDC01DRAFT_200921 [Geopyxis carbonaria]|nr:hypothetical protein EDC01DRAFT_200921 [Geopyxis carbonaria]
MSNFYGYRSSLLQIAVAALCLTQGQFAEATSYDFVIAGGGSAGLILAERLSQNASLSVMVIEAGGNPDIVYPLYSSTPFMAVFGIGSDPADTVPIDWGTVTTPQKGLGGRSIHYAQGKSLGGSSMRNFNVYTRGSCDTYNKWESLGNPGWGWGCVLPYFERSTSLIEPRNDLRFANASVDPVASLIGTSGPIQIGYPNEAAPFGTFLKEAMTANGLNKTADFTSGTLNGWQWASTTIDAAMNRSSSFSATFPLLSARSNVKLVYPALVKKVNFVGTKAVGVTYNTSTGELVTINATREVVISAGAFRSPQLLQVSGIGPAELLTKHGIPIIVNNKNVGGNLQDHSFFTQSYRVNMSSSTRFGVDPVYAEEKISEYLTDHTGPLTNNNCDFIAFEKYDNKTLGKEAAYNDFPGKWPHVEWASASGFVGNYSNPGKNQPTDGYDYATLMGILVAPKSRGSVKISSNDTADTPLIDPAFFTHPFDRKVLLETFKRGRKFLGSPEMAGAYSDPTEYYPGPSVQTDNEILQYIKENMMTIWHASSTCAMLPKARGGVVNSRLQVYGTTNLRVVDASIFPLVPPGHPVASVYMVAGKAADMILADVK